MSFRSTLVDKEGIRHISVTGRLDSATSGEFERSLDGIFGVDAARAVMDLKGLDYISSAGLRVVLMIAKRIKQANGRMIICGLQPNVRQVFEISGFLKILDVADDLGAAEAKLRGTAS